MKELFSSFPYTLKIKLKIQPTLLFFIQKKEKSIPQWVKIIKSCYVFS